MTIPALAKVNRAVETSLIGIAKLDEFGIITYNPLNEPVLRPVMRRASGEGSSRASGSQTATEERVRPTMTMMERMNILNSRLGKMETSMTDFGNDMGNITAVIAGMSEQFNGFCSDFRSLQDQQANLFRWNADRTSQMLAHMNLSHPSWNETDVVDRTNIPDTGVQHGISFMHPSTSSSAPQDAPVPRDTHMENDQNRE